jgi:hypothetical protein
VQLGDDNFRKIRLARVGNTAVSRGNRKTPFWIMTCFLADRGLRLSTSVGRLVLHFFNLRLVESFNIIFPFNTFNIHSLMSSNIRLSQFEIIPFLSFGLAVLSTCRMW